MKFLFHPVRLLHPVCLIDTMAKIKKSRIEPKLVKCRMKLRKYRNVITGVTPYCIFDFSDLVAFFLGN